jgi:hypothetical protein
MANFRKSLTRFLFVLAVIMVSVGLAEATTTSLTVEQGDEVKCPINLAVEDRVLIRFTVVGETASIVHFSLIFPNSTVKDFGEVGEFSYSFVCDAEGQYTLRFVNKDLTENKLVTLDYEVDHYVFGMPQMLFLTIIIVLACIGGVAAFVVMSGKL